MNNRLHLFQRIFRPEQYHRERLMRDIDLRQRLAWPSEIPQGMSLPDWTPLLLGTVQAADFVLGFAELGIRERAQLEEEIKKQAETIPEAEAKLLDERFELKQGLFEHTVLKKSVDLQVELITLNEQHIRRTGSVFLLGLAFLVACSISRITLNPFSVLIPQTTLGFASVLLLAPTLSFALYSRLLHATHKRREAIEQKLTRISAASHAFRALDRVQILQKRMEVKRSEQREETLEDERDKLEIEVKRREMLAAAELQRLARLLQMLETLESKEERLAILSAILPQHGETTSTIRANPSSRA